MNAATAREALRSRTRQREAAPRSDRALTFLLLAVAAAVPVGLWLRLDDSTVGFSPSAALGAIVTELPVTALPAAAVGLAVLLDLAAGAVVARLLRGVPFRSPAEAALEGFAGAVLLDATLLYVLGGIGLYRAPVVAAGLGLVVVAALAGRRRVPLFAAGGPRLRTGGLGRWPLVVLVWSGPVLLALASPVVPFLDVLPNHVAPVEHLRVFGSFETLATSPSPIYGASRVFAGYVGLLGSVATLAAVPAASAVAAFAIPLTILTAVGAWRLAGALFGPRAAYWTLIAFPLSFTFVRLADARDSVTALPLAACALVLVAGGPASRELDRRGGRPDRALAGVLAATVLVHPLVGAFAASAVAIVALADPRRYARDVGPALVAAAVAAIPQAAVMLGASPPPIAGAAAFVAALAVLEMLRRLATPSGRLRPAVPRRTRALALATLATAAALAAISVALLRPSLPSEAAARIQTGFPLLFCAAALVMCGLVPVRHAGRRLLAACVAAGLAAVLVAALAPGSTLEAQSLRYELTKAAGYWLPWCCVPAAAGIAAWLSSRRSRLPVPLRLALLAGLLTVAVFPLGASIPNTEQASHPAIDALAYDLRTAQRGYWQGYPDSRQVIDGPERDIVDYLGRLEASDALGPRDTVLHVAASYQQAASIPIGVFTGAIETTVCADATPTIFTFAGRLVPLADLPARLRAGDRFVVLEPAALPPSTRAEILAAGYTSLFANARGEVFERRG